MSDFTINDINKDFINEYINLFQLISSVKHFPLYSFTSMTLKEKSVCFTSKSKEGKNISFPINKIKRKAKEDFKKILNDNKVEIDKLQKNKSPKELKPFFIKHKNYIYKGITDYFKEISENDFSFSFVEDNDNLIVNIKYNLDTFEYKINLKEIDVDTLLGGNNFSRPKIISTLNSSIKKFINTTVSPSFVKKYWNESEEKRKLKCRIISNINRFLNSCYNNKYKFWEEGGNITITYNGRKYKTGITLIHLVDIDKFIKITQKYDGLEIPTCDLSFKNVEYFDFISDIANNIKEKLNGLKLVLDYSNWDNINETINKAFSNYNNNAFIFFNGYAKAKGKNIKCYSYFDDLDTIYIESKLQNITYNFKTDKVDVKNTKEYDLFLDLVNNEDYVECKNFWDDITSSKPYSFQYRKGKGVLFGDVELNITDKIKDYTIVKQIKINSFNDSVNLWKREIVKIFKDLDFRFEKYGDVLKTDFLAANPDITDNFLVLDILGLLKQNSWIEKNDVVKILKGKSKVENINDYSYFGKYSLLNDNEILKTLEDLEKKELIISILGDKFAIKDHHYYNYLNPDLSSLRLNLDDKIQNEEILTDTESLYMLNQILSKESLTLNDYIKMFSLFNNIRFASRHLGDILSIFKLAPSKLKNKEESDSLNIFLKMKLCSDTSVNKKKIIQRIVYSDKYN